MTFDKYLPMRNLYHIHDIEHFHQSEIFPSLFIVDPVLPLLVPGNYWFAFGYWSFAFLGI